jgi:hypothetical protein
LPGRMKQRSFSAFCMAAVQAFNISGSFSANIFKYKSTGNRKIPLFHK